MTYRRDALTTAPRPRGGARPRLAALVLGLAALAARPATADPLFILLDPAPDISASGISLSYNATTDLLTATGFPAQFKLDGTTTGTFTSGTFSLGAKIDGTGALVADPGNTFTIVGAVPALGIASTTILTGNLTRFGFPAAGGSPFEFTFTPTGGYAVTTLGLFSGTGGIILSNISSAFTGSFASSFNATAVTGDLGQIVPEPGALAALLVGLASAGLAGAPRRRRAHAAP